MRGYLAVGLSTSNVGTDSASNTFSANRAFIQWAGFTFGLAQSFYDFYSVPATSYWGSFPASDTGDPGWMVLGYTAQFGNGFSATLAAEMRRMTQIVGNNGGAIFPGGYGSIGAGAGSYGGFQAPDIVGNLRVDQSWGSAQIMGALHQVNGMYYLFGGSGGIPASGHPDDKVGWVIGAGLKLNAPMIGHGDFLQAQVNYTEGALRYIFQTPNSNWGKNDGADAGFGVLSDAVYSGNSRRHRRCGRYRSQPHDGLERKCRLRALLESALADIAVWWLRCRHLQFGRQQFTLPQLRLGQLSDLSGCDMNWSTWWLGTRTQWNVTKDFYMGLDVLYQHMESANPMASSH